MKQNWISDKCDFRICQHFLICPTHVSCHLWCTDSLPRGADDTICPQTIRNYRGTQSIWKSHVVTSFFLPLQRLKLNFGQIAIFVFINIFTAKPGRKKRSTLKRCRRKGTYLRFMNSHYQFQTGLTMQFYACCCILQHICSILTAYIDFFLWWNSPSRWSSSTKKEFEAW